jgi:hypothetical protein
VSQVLLSVPTCSALTRSGCGRPSNREQVPTACLCWSSASPSWRRLLRLQGQRSQANGRLVVSRDSPDSLRLWVRQCPSKCRSSSGRPDGGAGEASVNDGRPPRGSARVLPASSTDLRPTILSSAPAVLCLLLSSHGHGRSSQLQASRQAKAAPCAQTGTAWWLEVEARQQGGPVLSARFGLRGGEGASKGLAERSKILNETNPGRGGP